MLTQGEAAQNNCSGPAILNASYSVFNVPSFGGEVVTKWLHVTVIGTVHSVHKGLNEDEEDDHQDTYN